MFVLSQLIYNYMSFIISKILFMGSSFSSTHVSSSSSSESSSSSYLDTKKESAFVFSVTAKSIESTSSLRASIDAERSKGSIPFVYQQLKAISLPSDDAR